MGSILDLLTRLIQNDVRFVLVGGLAGVAHGSPVVTYDLDVCTTFDLENITRILAAISDLHPRHRMRPDHLPLSTDPATFVGWNNLNVLTDWGIVDFLGEITGVGDYQSVSRLAVTMDLHGHPCQVIGLDALIEAKRAVGRPKDRRTVVELEALRRRLRGES